MRIASKPSKPLHVGADRLPARGGLNHPSGKRPLGATIALLLALAQAPALAATIEVTPGVPPSILRDGKCSLIEALANANRDARIQPDCAAGEGADTIVLPPLSDQALKARESLPKIWSRIVIEGHGSTIRRVTSEYTQLNFFNVTAAGNLTLVDTTVSGATASGMQGGNGGIDNAGGTLTLRNSTITTMDGQPGLTNSGTATLEDSIVSNNGRGSGAETYDAGGILNRGTLVLRDSIVTGNGAWFSGAGILNATGASLKLFDSEVSQNLITYEGLGAGITNAGELVLVRSSVSGNRADAAAGISNTGTATILSSTVSGNVVSSAYNYGTGGGISNRGKMTLANSTVSGNRADLGGGINQFSSGSLEIVHSTITGNAARLGGGLFVQWGTARLQRTIVSGNTAERGAEISAEPYFRPEGGEVVADDHNLFGHNGDAGVFGFAPGPTDKVAGTPLGRILVALADNGGGTLTHALAIGSPALDAAPAGAGCPAVDQRGNPRPRGPACDIGAFEGSATFCNGRVTTMVGTTGPDELTGTADADVVAGLGGDDVIAGLAGDDVVCGGAGADIVHGAAGNDALFGQGGNDRLLGHRGADALDGGPGTDDCDGGLDGAAGDTAVACESVRSVP